MALKAIYIEKWDHFTDVVVPDLAPINIFVGPNNAGKTRLLRAMEACCGSMSGSFIESTIRLGFAVRHPTDCQLDEVDRAVLNRCAVGRMKDGWQFLGAEADFRKLKIQGYHHIGHESFVAGNPGRTAIVVQVEGKRTAYPLSNFLEGQAPGAREWASKCFFIWHRRKAEYQSSYSPDLRLDAEAVNLTNRLAYLLQSEPQFRQRITAFVNDVIPGLENPIVRRVKKKVVGPNAKQEVGFQTGDRFTPLDRLGGGVEQVLTLGVLLLGEPPEGGIFLEEPETHLHPDAQFRLIEKIKLHRGERQVFITTHSPAFIDGFAEDANVYRVFRDENHGGAIELCARRQHKRTALDDLGLRASALLQANCVIWVEGPSDAILIRHWLKLVDPALDEHRHFEFAFTGGAVIAKLAADTADTDPLTDVFRMSRYNFLVADRDGEPGVALKANVQRFLDLKAKLGPHLECWVTEQYEIEWYWPRQLVGTLWPKVKLDQLYGDKAGATNFYPALKEAGGPKTEAKVEYAGRAVMTASDWEDPASLWFDHKSDLKQRVAELAEFVRMANGLSEAAQPATLQPPESRRGRPAAAPHDCSRCASSTARSAGKSTPSADSDTS